MNLRFHSQKVDPGVEVRLVQSVSFVILDSSSCDRRCVQPLRRGTDGFIPSLITNVNSRPRAGHRPCARTHCAYNDDTYTGSRYHGVRHEQLCPFNL